MTIVALVLQIIVQLGGKTPNSSLLNSVYAWEADFTAFRVDSGLNEVEQVIGDAVENSIHNRQLRQVYQIHVYVR